jgi:hypothetical protein
MGKAFALLLNEVMFGDDRQFAITTVVDRSLRVFPVNNELKVFHHFYLETL